jgi:hypothetical protein
VTTVDTPPTWFRCPADEQFHAFPAEPANTAILTSACGYTTQYALRAPSPESRRCPACLDLVLTAVGTHWHEISQWLT